MLTLVSNNPTPTQSCDRYQEAMKDASMHYDCAIALGMDANAASRKLARDTNEAWEEYRNGRGARVELRSV